jgi:hypothetical protein
MFGDCSKGKADLMTKLIASMDGKLNDISEGLLSACSLTKFKQWPKNPNDNNICGWKDRKQGHNIKPYSTKTQVEKSDSQSNTQSDCEQNE